MVEKEKPTSTAVAKKKEEPIVTSVLRILKGHMQKGELIMPADYSVDNALKAAWLTLQETKDKDKKPVLTACSQISIANALIDMAVQGLNPVKDQCYFIAHGNKLTCRRSYFGTMAVCQRVANASDIWAEVVYEGDVFEYDINHNRKSVTKHTQKLENIKPGKIVAAYCVVEFSDSRLSTTEIMTMEQIKKAWAKSQMKGSEAGVNKTQSEFPEEMAKRTIINRTCKPLINASSDNNLLLDRFNKSDDELAEEEIAGEIEEHANQDFIDIDTGEIGEAAQETLEEPSAKPEAENKGEGQQELSEPGF